jgi:hypothetical protein
MEKSPKAVQPPSKAVEPVKLRVAEWTDPGNLGPLFRVLSGKETAFGPRQPTMA